MEMSNLTSKLKSLKLELGEDLLVYLVLISLPVYFGQFKVSYNTQKDKWSLNELISHCVQEEERLQRHRTESAHLTLTSQNKKRKKTKGAAEETSQQKKQNKDEEFACYFCKKSGHMKKECPKYAAWHVKKDKFLTLVCSEVNLAFVPKDTWWVDSGATTHISMTMQGCLWSQLPSDDERFIFVGDGKKIAMEAIETLKLQLKTGFYLDLFETFVVPSFRWNLISISSLDKFGFSCSFGNNKVSLYQNSNMVGSGSLIDNFYMLDVNCSYNEILQTNSRGIKRKLKENSATLWHKQIQIKSSL